MFCLEKYIGRSAKTAWRIIDNNAMVMTPHDTTLHVLDEVATRIWELADGKRTIKGVIDKIYEEFEVDYETVQKDVLEFVKELLSKEMAILSDTEIEEGG